MINGLLAAVLISAKPLALSAQERSPAAPSRLCFRGRPKPACDRFVIAEIGLYHPVLRTQRALDFDPLLIRYPTVERQVAIQVGGMVNRGSRSAVGGTLLLGIGTGAADVGVVGRYRRWLSIDGMSVDMAAGVIHGRISEANGRSAGGIMAEVGLNAADYGALVVRTDVLRGSGGTNAALFGGARLGSRPAVAAGVLLGIGVSLLLAALADSDF